MAFWVIPIVKARGGRTSAKHDLAVKLFQYVWGACTHCFRQGRLDSIFKLTELKLFDRKGVAQKICFFNISVKNQGKRGWSSVMAV